MSDMRQKLLPVFLQEAGRKIAQLDQFFLGAGSKEQSLEELEAAFRAAHTLKGTAALVQADAVCTLSARLEGLLEGHFEKNRFPSAVEYEAMSLALDILRQLVAAVEKGEPEPPGRVTEAELALKLATAMPGARHLGELFEHPSPEDPFAEDPSPQGDEGPVCKKEPEAPITDPFAEDPVFEAATPPAVGVGFDPFAEDPDPLTEDASTLSEQPASAFAAGTGSSASAKEPGVAIEIDDPFAEDPEPVLAANADPEQEVPPTKDPEPAAVEAASVEKETPRDSSTDLGDLFAEDPDLDMYVPAAAAKSASLDAVGDGPVAEPVAPARESFAERMRKRLEEENPLGTAERLASTLLTQRGEVRERGYSCCNFQVGGKDYYLPIANMIEIADLPRVIRLPLAPPVVRGLVNLRGQVLPLIDLAVLADGTTPYVAVRKLVVAEADGERLAFLADGIPNLSETLVGEKVDVSHFVEQFRAGAS